MHEAFTSILPNIYMYTYLFGNQVQYVKELWVTERIFEIKILLLCHVCEVYVLVYVYILLLCHEYISAWFHVCISVLFHICIPVLCNACICVTFHKYISVLCHVGISELCQIFILVLCNFCIYMHTYIVSCSI